MVGGGIQVNKNVSQETTNISQTRKQRTQNQELKK